MKMKNPIALLRKRKDSRKRVHKELEDHSVQLPPHYSEIADVGPKHYDLPAEFLDHEEEIYDRCRAFLEHAGVADQFNASYYNYILEVLYHVCVASLRSQRSEREHSILRLGRSYEEELIHLHADMALAEVEKAKLEEALSIYEYIACKGTIFEEFCPVPNIKKEEI